MAEVGKLDTQTLELDRRDLAGVRIIFYTNNDVERFLQSSLIRDNFEVEEDSTKIHHPIPENEGTRYRATHFTVSLGNDRILLPEYARFTGLRCEVQIQTILNHAWSETSHDILYKDRPSEGYGSRAMKGIKRRFKRIMDEYLLPAGFEIQKAQQDYERLLQGKELFDQDIANQLDNAQNNNERYAILSGLKDYALPNYDDLSAAYEGLKGPLLRAVIAARNTDSVPIETTYGKFEGFKADAITRLVIEIVENLRYVDVVGTLQLLVDIYRGEQNKDIQQQVLTAVNNLSQYNIDIYKQAGPMLQIELINYLSNMEDTEIDSIRPIALIVWTDAIRTEITGTRWRADSVDFLRGSVPITDKLREVRAKAMKALFATYDRSTDDEQKRAVLSALYAAAWTPIQGEYSNELLTVTLKDTLLIVEFITERAETTSYELLQHIEEKFLHYYRRAKSLTDDPENQFGCQLEAGELIATILKFRDAINVDEQFVRYKILVGFESVYPGHWTDKEFRYKMANEYRQREADSYIDQINETNEDDWFNLITRCATTKSNDHATFPVFGNFISKLAARKPELADRFLAKASNDLRNFLPGLLSGLARSGRGDIYERTLESELESARNLAGVARHLRYSEVKKPEFATRLLKRVIELSDSIAVNECFLFVIEYYGTEKIVDPDTFARDAMAFLNDHEDTQWIWEGWYLESAKFYEELTPERTTQLLQNLGYLHKVDHHVESILVRLAKRQKEAVWDYFEARLAREETDGEEERFEAVPFRLHSLQNELSKDPQLGIRKGLTWFTQDPKLFAFRGGRLLGSAFPNCTPEFAEALTDLVKAGGDTEANFALAILRNYHDEISTHIVLKEIVSRFPDDTSKMGRVENTLYKTGWVSGELGLAEAYRNKKETLKEWLEDERPPVQSFAEKHIAQLDHMIASEHRRAETEIEMRKRSYDEENSKSDHEDVE